MRTSALTLASILAFGNLAAAVTIDTVPVSNADPGTGAYQVDYAYRIGTYEVTNAQYAEFLNTKARTDVYSLYNTEMSSSAAGGISRAGTSGSYIYSTKPDMANKPVNFVSWFDAARFVNWLHNGQGSGDTEDGVYRITGDPYIDYYASRQNGATWALPNANEWKKAAYYEPLIEHIPGYGDWVVRIGWGFATRSSTIPDVALADASGNISNPGTNVVNYNFGADWNGQAGNVTTVGSAGPDGASPFGTYDQSGNVAEWGEHYNNPDYGLYQREIYGGSFRSTNYSDLGSSAHKDLYNDWERDYVGFRVVQLNVVVPEPSTLAIAVVGLVGLLFVARRHKRT